ncbi:MAG: hypothetical protein H6575_00725 [Lewinellaceae bacterium]|nr:hypothetical protein [Saprospiraceae bacterium]MCB9353076.1 hypothetical protein [Lewinellaceae bacterium]
MKVTTAKQGFRSVLAAIFLFGALLFSASSANAQTNDADLSLNWVTESEALSALENSVGLLVVDQANYPQGSPNWNNIANHINYYKLIMGLIEEGNTVPVSVGNGVLMMNDDKNASKDLVPAATLTQLRADATTLLTL